MKKITIILFSVFSCTTSFSQLAKKNVSTSHTNIIKLGGNTFFGGDEFNLGVAWEFKIANKQSLQVGILPRLYKSDFEKRNGVALSLAYRKYISKNKEGLQGLYFSPTIKYGILNEEYSNGGYYDYTNPTNPVFVSSAYKDKVNSFNVAFLFGKQWVYKSGFSLDLSGGIGFFNNNYSNGGRRYSYNYSGFGNNDYGITPNLNISIGYAF